MSYYGYAGYGPYGYEPDSYGYAADEAYSGLRYGNGLFQQDVREYGPGRYGPDGHAQYYGGQSLAGYAYYVLNTDKTLTYFAGGSGGPGGPPMYYGAYGSYDYAGYGASYGYDGYAQPGAYYESSSPPT